MPAKPAPRKAKARRERPVPTFDHLAKKKRFEIRDWIPLGDDEEESADYAAARRTLEHAKVLDASQAEIDAAQEALDKAREALEDRCVEVIFRVMDPKEFEKLTRRFPPDEKVAAEQKQQYGQAMMWDPEKLTPYVVAASCVQPVMTPDQVESLITVYKWNAEEYGHLFQLAIDVNTKRRQVNWGN